MNKYRNQYGTHRLPPEKTWSTINKAKLKREPVKLRASQRVAAELAIRETCEIRQWNLLAINVRTNHVHSVVKIGNTNPSMALNAFKANAIRKMRESGCWISSDSPWVAKGSKRRLWNGQSIHLAIDYVINRQGDDLPDF